MTRTLLDLPEGTMTLVETAASASGITADQWCRQAVVARLRALALVTGPLTRLEVVNPYRGEIRVQADPQAKGTAQQAAAELQTTDRPDESWGTTWRKALGSEKAFHAYVKAGWNAALAKYHAERMRADG